MAESASFADTVSAIRAFLRGKGLRFTPQRQRIVEVFMQSAGHLTTEELYDRVRREAAL